MKQLILSIGYTKRTIETLCRRLDEPVTIQIIYDHKDGIGSNEHRLFEHAVRARAPIVALVKKWTRDPAQESGETTIVFHGALFDIAGNPTVLYDELAYWNLNYSVGIFFCPTEMDGEGRSKENALSPRAVFVDLDNKTGTAESHLATILKREGFYPHLVIQSSTPGRYHVYWRVEGLSIRAYRYAQEELAKKFDGDPAVKAQNQLMRLPGFYHHKGEPVLTKVIYFSYNPSFPATLFDEPPPRAPSTPVLGTKPTEKFTLDLVHSQLLALTETPPGFRNGALNRISFTLGGLVWLGYFTREWLEDKIFQATVPWGNIQSHRKDQKCIARGIGDGMEEPFTPSLHNGLIEGIGPHYHIEAKVVRDAMVQFLINDLLRGVGLIVDDESEQQRIEEFMAMLGNLSGVEVEYQPKSKRFIIKVTPGLGKSLMILELLSEALSRVKQHYEIGPVLYLCPNLTLAHELNEAYARYINVLRVDGSRADYICPRSMVFYGRLYKVDGKETLCKRPEVVEYTQSLGISNISATCCETEIKFPDGFNQRIVCPQIGDCPYYQELDVLRLAAIENSCMDVIFASHAELNINRNHTYFPNEYSLVVIDEEVASQQNSNHFVALDDIEATGEPGVAIANAARAAHQKAIENKLEENDTSTLINERILDAIDLMAKRKQKSAPELLWGATTMRDEFEHQFWPDMDLATRKSLVSKWEGHTTPKRHHVAATALKQLGDEIVWCTANGVSPGNPDRPNSDLAARLKTIRFIPERTLIDEKTKDKAKVKGFKLSYTKDLIDKTLADSHIVFLDANAPEHGIRSMFETGEDFNKFEMEASLEHMTFTQVYGDSLAGRKLKGKGRKQDENRQKVLNFCQHLYKVKGHKTGVLFTYKDTRERIDLRLLPQGWHIAHYGMERGTNRYANVECVVLAGRFMVDEEVHKDLAAAWYRLSAEDLDWTSKPAWLPRGMTMKNGRKLGILQMVYLDALMDDIRAQATEVRMMQALHRSRPVNRTRDNPVYAYNISNVVLPVFVDEAMPFADGAGYSDWSVKGVEKIEVKMTGKGVPGSSVTRVAKCFEANERMLVLTGSWLAEKFPEEFVSEQAAKDVLKEIRATIGLETFLKSLAPGARLFEVALEGGGQPKRIVSMDQNSASTFAACHFVNIKGIKLRENW